MNRKHHSQPVTRNQQILAPEEPPMAINMLANVLPCEDSGRLGSVPISGVCGGGGASRACEEEPTSPLKPMASLENGQRNKNKIKNVLAMSTIRKLGSMLLLLLYLLLLRRESNGFQEWHINGEEEDDG
ncbi:hypothetical protein FNV43_RR21001 [Rhamnella rubrinervis]|uniref:Uncharacterized protein n=1 Tax=Rhamnella rubrinervis TaxID=2594499 RepID=A0A8K0E2H9_9ROSA|nr:hypothetical protein FNV43_RR21001 [Rhamnella rubrinervis]